MRSSTDLEALRLLFEQLDQDGRGRRSTVEYLIRSLTILDAKSASLLILNSIVIAALSIFFLSQNRPVSVTWISALGAFAVFLASAAQLWVVWPHWITAESLDSPDHFVQTLFRMRSERTRWCRTGLQLSGVSLVLLVVDFLVFLRS